MKTIRVLIAALLALVLLSACGVAAPVPTPENEEGAQESGAPLPEAEAPESESGTETAETPEAEVPVSEALFLEDFSVRTIDGADFSLSEQLRDHELVLINLWATWCGPCAMEFPYLQEAWSQCSDRVAVIALSIEPEDTEEVLRSYAADRGLSFPIGRAEGTDLARFVTVGIPTSLLIDREGRVAAVEVGAKLSAQEFLDWFDTFSGDSYDPAVCSYTVCAYDGLGAGVEGVVVNFCTDTTCTPVTTDAEGVAVFTGPPARYHVQVIRVPDGMRLLDADEWVTEPYGQTFWLPLAEAAA